MSVLHQARLFIGLHHSFRDGIIRSFVVGKEGRRMMKRARALDRLQTVEASIAQKSRRLQDVEAQLSDSDAVQAAERAVDEAETRLANAEAVARRLDLETRSIESEIKAVEGQLYSGRVANPKELASLEEKLGQLRTRHSQLEDDQLENMLESEQAESAVAEDRQHLAHVESEWTAEQADLTDEKGALEQDLSTLRGEQGTLRESISAEDLDVFDDLCRRKGGKCVVIVEDGVCRGCGVSVPLRTAEAALRADDLVFCGSCERILLGRR